MLFNKQLWHRQILFGCLSLLLVSVLVMVITFPKNLQMSPSAPSAEEVSIFPHESAQLTNDSIDAPDDFVYENEEFYVLPRFSNQIDFLDYGVATFIIAMNKVNGTVSCFLTRGEEILYKFPKSDIYAAHLGSDVPQRRKYEGVFFQDLDGDSIEDIIILTYGSYGNWPQDVNLATVFLQKEGEFLPLNDISEASLYNSIDKTGYDGDVDYITLDDVYSYLQEDGSSVWSFVSE